MHLTARATRSAAALLCLLIAAGPLRADDYPTRAVSIITAGSAGTGPDVMARLIADRLTQAWGQQVVVINRPGALGSISLQVAASARPDGYTLYLGFASLFVVFPQTQPNIAPDVDRLVSLGLLGEQPMVICVSPKLGVSSLAELFVEAKKRPGEILFGTFRGTMPHLTGALLAKRAGVDLRFIPSLGPHAIQNVLQGSLHVAIEGMGALAGLIQSGLLKPLAVAARSRLPDYPGIPTVSEAAPGLADFEARGWVALFAPRDTPSAIVDKINRDLRSALLDPQTAHNLSLQGVYPRPMSPEETTEFIRNEKDLWRPVIRQLDLATQ